MRAALLACVLLAALLPSAAEAQLEPLVASHVPDGGTADGVVRTAFLPDDVRSMVAMPKHREGSVETADLPLTQPSSDETVSAEPAQNVTAEAPMEAPVEEPAPQDPPAEDAAPSQHESVPPAASPPPAPAPPNGASEPEPQALALARAPDRPSGGGWQGFAFPALALGLGAAAFLPWLRRWLPGPHYLHVDRERALAHPGRQALVAAVARQAGATLPELAAAVGMGRTNAAYHLSVLEWHGLLRTAGVGRRRHFAPAGAGDPRPLALLRSERRRRIAAYVLEHPDCLQKDICASLRIPLGRVHEQVRRLHEAGLVSRTAAGRAVRLRATDALLGLGPLLAPAA